MMNLEQLKARTELIEQIDWDMTPEEAVRLYLEWGNNWARSNYVIRSKSDFSCYFMVYAWEGDPVIYLIRRNSENAEELAQIRMPERLIERFREKTGYNKGVYSLDGELRQWLETHLKSN